MKNENRAVFDRAPEPIVYAFDFPAKPEVLPPSPKGIARVIRWIVTKLRSRRDSMALLELSDDQLKDVGISRGQIDSDPSRYRMSQSHGLERHRF